MTTTSSGPTVMSAAPAPRAISTASADDASAPTAASAMRTSASGSVEDSSAACLARVPKDATAGQRMMAEQSCTRDAAERKSIQAVPGK